MSTGVSAGYAPVWCRKGTHGKIARLSPESIPTPSPHEAPLPAERHESLRIRLTALRSELREQIGVVVESAELLLDDSARDATPEFDADVNRILTAARRLLAMVDEAFGPEALDAGPIDTEALGSHLRHELRT